MNKAIDLWCVCGYRVKYKIPSYTVERIWKVQLDNYYYYYYYYYYYKIVLRFFENRGRWTVWHQLNQCYVTFSCKFTYHWIFIDTYIVMLCQLNGDLLYKHRHLSVELRRLEQCQSDAAKHLIQQTKTVCHVSVLPSGEWSYTNISQDILKSLWWIQYVQQQ